MSVLNAPSLPSILSVKVKEWAPLVGKAKQRKSDEKFYSDEEEEKEEEGSDSSGSEDSSSSSSSSGEALCLFVCLKVYVFCLVTFILFRV